MAQAAPTSAREDPREVPLMRVMAGFFDAKWYQTRYPDTIVADLHPLRHFIRHGLAERRDPNRFFDGAWYTGHYPDVGVSGLHPLLHYLQTGASALRNPNPHFDAAWYVQQHPDAASNPLLYHIGTGLALGFPTEKPFDIRNYLPSEMAAPNVPRKIVVDVIIPVYRGLEETQRCIASVLANTGRPLGRIIVVDDCSPEADLSAWLQQLAVECRIHLVRNKRNIGFVASVNRGMQEAKSHDVVLLNSDTEVQADWLSRLTAQAYAESRIATVSPFSNNATICSYPNDRGGPIVLGQSVAAIDDICRTVNIGRWVDVPTTVGFCMYIRRKALQDIGDFDAERFTVGYGEENDFCLRASHHGWKHRLACDVFVYHKGSVSFGDRTNTLSKRAMDLLLERYPHYQRDIAQHVSLGAVIPFRFAVTASLFRQSKLPVILMVAHELGGGVHRHIDDIAKRFQNQARFLLLEATDLGAALSVLSLPDHPALTLPAERLDDLVLVLRSMNVSRVHIHHLLGMDMDIRRLIHRMDVPFDLTVHDYYGICPQINLLPWRHSLYCGEPDIAGCNACIANRSSHGARDIVTWRAEQAWQFKDAARVFCPSMDVLLRLERHGLAANAVFAPHEAVEAEPWPLKIVRPTNGILKIAVLGTLVDHKGGRTVASVAELADPKTTEIHLIGHTDGHFPVNALKRMKVTGRYDEAELASLIETIAPHVIWFPAVWPETFSFTLSAAIKAGVAIVATRVGAFPERLAGRTFTWLVDIGLSPMNWISIFDEVRDVIISATVGNAAAMRPTVTDFYMKHHLQPCDATRPMARGRRKPRILVVPERFDTGCPTPCGYIRLLQPLHHLAVVADFDVRVANAETVLDQDADIIVTQRFAMKDITAADRLREHARGIGATLVFDLDDDLLNIPRSHPEAEMLRPRARVVRRMLDGADVVWVSTPRLAERLRPVRSDTVVVPNGLDERIWTPPAMPSIDQPVRILCMGTITHERDFAMIEPALSRLKTEYDDRVVIDIVGMTGQSDLSPGLNRISLPPNARRSYAGFVNWLTSATPPWHIGLAPLRDTPFNLCKSPIKAMEYAAMGLVVLASDMPVYQDSIADGPAGQLVQNSPAAWYSALTWLLRNRDLRRRVAGQSRDVFVTQASLASQAYMRRSALLRLRNVGKAQVVA